MCIARCLDGTILSRWPTDAQSTKPQATVPSFVFKFRRVIQHRHGLAIYGVRRKLGTDSRDSLRKDTCILCGNCFNREIPRPQLDDTSPALLVNYTNSPESLLILKSVTTRMPMKHIAGPAVGQVLVTHARKTCSKSRLYNSWNRGQHAVILALLLMSKCNNVKTPQIARTCSHLHRHAIH